MNNVVFYKWGVFLAILLFAGCSYDFPTQAEPVADTGRADLSNIKVLGGRLVSGYMDGALYSQGQDLSYPRIFSDLLDSTTIPNPLTQLEVTAENGYNISASEFVGSPSGKYYLTFRSEITGWPVRIPEDGNQSEDFSGQLATANDLSVPYLKSYQLNDPSLPQNNEYLSRIAAVQNGQSILDQAISSSPTFILADPGSEDIFSYAMNGADGNENPDVNDPVELSNGLTPVSLFSATLDEMVNEFLNQTGADLVLQTIPDPVLTPFFTELSWFFNDAEFSRLSFSFSFYANFNSAVNEYNDGIPFQDRRPLIIFDGDGGSVFRAKVIEDEYLPDATDNSGNPIPKYRQMTQDDYFLYSAEQVEYNSINSTTAFGTTDPIADRYVLTETEASIIDQRRQAFNDLIRQAAAGNERIHILDVEQLVDDVSDELVSSRGTTFSLEFDHRGIVSADGYSFNPKGQALIANELVKLLNSEFGAVIPFVDPNVFRGTEYRLTD